MMILLMINIIIPLTVILLQVLLTIILTITPTMISDNKASFHRFFSELKGGEIIIISPYRYFLAFSRLATLQVSGQNLTHRKSQKEHPIGTCH